MRVQIGDAVVEVELTDLQKRMLAAGSSVTVSLYPDPDCREYTAEALKRPAEWSDRRYSKPGTRSIHNKGEAIMEPYWAKPTLDERLTVNTGPEKSEYDIISRPSHYEAGRKYAPKDVIRDWGLNYNLGSAVKYLARAGRKDAIINDLEKARTFIQFEIEALAEEGEEEE